MDEVDVEPVDVGGELVESVQLRLAGTPVVPVRPIRRELSRVVQRDSLAPVVDALGLGPAGASQPPAEVVEIFIGDGDAVKWGMAASRGGIAMVGVQCGQALLGRSRPTT